MRVMLLVLLMLPQIAAARVYMCQDPATGKTTFSDKGCASAVPHEEIRIQSTNVASGRSTAGPVERKAWVSDRDTRKTGRDYFAEKRKLLESSPTASAAELAVSQDS